MATAAMDVENTVLRDAVADENAMRIDEDGVDETKLNAIEADGGESSPVVAAASVIAAESDMVEGAIERDDFDGRKKRKERENRVGNIEDVEAREERKKRKEERDRRRSKETREGSEKREHREGREKKDSKRKKYKKKRKEDKDGKSRKHRLLDEDGMESKGSRRKEAKSSDEGGESTHEIQSFVDAPSTKSTKSDAGRNTLLSLDDDKEEGEIVEEDLGYARVAESEAESGEIKIADDNRESSRDKSTSKLDSVGKMNSSQWSSHGAGLPRTNGDFSTVDRIGRISSRSFRDKADHALSSNPLQSMHGIAEAYESECSLSDEKSGPPATQKAELVSDTRLRDSSRRSGPRDRERKFGFEMQKTEIAGHFTDKAEHLSNEHREKESSKRENVSVRRENDWKGRSSDENGVKRGDVTGRKREHEPPVGDNSKSKLRRGSDSSEDSQEFRGSDPERRRTRSPTGERADARSRSPSPLEGTHTKDRRKDLSASPKAVRDRDRRSDRSRSKDKRAERPRSRSLDSTRGGTSSRRRSRSPENVRERVFHKARSPPRDSPRDRRIERVRRSHSRDSDSERRHFRNRSSLIDRRRRSRSRESLRIRSSARGDSVGRRRRSRSRDSSKERTRDGSRRHGGSTDRRRRSKSRDGRIEDRIGSRQSLERRRRSRSKESVRDHTLDARDSGRHNRRGDDFQHRSSRDDRSSHDNRHNEVNRDVRHRLDRGRDRNDVSTHDKNRSRRDSKADVSKQSGRDSINTIRDEENQEKYQERVASQLAAQEDDDVDRVKEESRKRRQAIIEKYKKKQEKSMEKDDSTGPDHSTNGVPVATNIAPRESMAQPQSPPVNVFSPSSDDLSVGKAVRQNGVMATHPEDGGLGSGTPKSERMEDIFGDDIFEESPAGRRRLGKSDGFAMDTSGLTDNWDDAEGYYSFRIGEVLDGHYEVASSHGRGVFSTVVRARDLKPGEKVDEVAIKIIRNNETMYKAGQQELVILKKLAGADPENKRHCVQLISSFEYRSHLCLVFESLHMNLREILKKFGRNIGLNLNAVRAYAKQLFISLKHLRNCGVLHCDIKPDNMLVNESLNVLKLCDFGSAMFAGENEITPYLVSRFYRAPEIILGLPYDHALDIWSVGCCLYELYTGKMLFPGHTNNDMLRLHMELKGPFPKKMLRKAAFADQHFDQDFNFCAIEEDPVTKKAIKRILVNKPRDVGILVSSSGTVDEDPKMLNSFKDLLEKIFILDPDKRLTVSQAMSHPFISGK